MVTMVTEKRVLNWRQVDAEYDGEVLLMKGWIPKKEGNQ
jgi:hypothetical protein